MRIDFSDKRAGFTSEAEQKTPELLQAVADAVAEQEAPALRLSATLAFYDPETMREVNRDYRSVDAVTDVLSFPMLEGRLAEATPATLIGDYDPEDGSLFLGDILICVERAKEQAEDYGHSAERELAYLFAHGLLHLLGYDHMEDGEREEMRRHEESALAKLGLTRD